jgi:putative nucleotidyltransferase with HDIG domain
MTREEALALLHQHVKTPNLIKHMLASEALMRGLAKRFGEDENKWGLAGLLHDLDYDDTKAKPDQHSLMAYEWLKATDIDPEIAEAIKIHNPLHGLEPKTLMDKALYCGEGLTGLVVAATLVLPDKKLASLTSESVLKKFKSKSFAAGTKRELIARCQELLGLSLEELTEICLREMQGIAAELGL